MSRDVQGSMRRDCSPHFFSSKRKCNYSIPKKLNLFSKFYFFILLYVIFYGDSKNPTFGYHFSTKNQRKLQFFTFFKNWSTTAVRGGFREHIHSIQNFFLHLTVFLKIAHMWAQKSLRLWRSGGSAAHQSGGHWFESKRLQTFFKEKLLLFSGSPWSKVYMYQK